VDQIYKTIRFDQWTIERSILFFDYSIVHDFLWRKQRCLLVYSFEWSKQRIAGSYARVASLKYHNDTPISNYAWHFYQSSCIAKYATKNYLLCMGNISKRFNHCASLGENFISSFKNLRVTSRCANSRDNRHSNMAIR